MNSASAVRVTKIKVKKDKLVQAEEILALAEASKLSLCYALCWSCSGERFHECDCGDRHYCCTCDSRGYVGSDLAMFREANEELRDFSDDAIVAAALLQRERRKA